MMIRSLFLCLSMLCLSPLYGQSDAAYTDSDHLSLGLALGFGHKNLLLGGGASLVTPSQWGISLRYRFNIIEDAEQLPRDYDAGLCFFQDCIPHDFVHFYSLSLLREFSLPGGGLFGLEGGPSLAVHRFASFTRAAQSWFGSNYEHTYQKESAIGLSARLFLKTPATDFVGVEGALVTQFNKLQSFVGLELLLQLYLIR